MPSALHRFQQHPDDLNLAQVCADELQQQGDPRGELIALQIALSQSPGNHGVRQAVEALMHKHRKHWLGPWVKVKDAHFEWKWGLLRTIWLFPWYGDQAERERQLTEALAAEVSVDVSRCVLFECHELEALRAWVRTLKLPPRLGEVELPVRFDTRSAGEVNPAAVRWASLWGEMPSWWHKATQIEVLELHGAGSALPAGFEQLPLRQLSVSYGELTDLPETLFGMETLRSIVTYNSDSLPKEFHMARMNALLAGFAAAFTPKRRRIIEFNLLVNRLKRASQLADDDDLYDALDSNVEVVRANALQCLESRPSALGAQPLSSSAVVAMAGTFARPKASLVADVEATGARLAKKGEQPTHWLLGHSHQGKAHAGGVRFIERHLERGAAKAPAASRAALELLTLTPESLGAALTSLHDVELTERQVREVVVVQQDLELPTSVRAAAKKLLTAQAPLVIKAMTKLRGSLMLPALGEHKRTEYLRAFCRAAQIDAEALAMLLLERRQVCTDFLFFRCGAATANRALEVLTRASKSLNLNTRELDDLPAGVAKVGLEHALLPNNHFSDVPDSLLKAKNLRTLDLTRNNLWRLTLPEGTWPTLESLDLSFNRFKRFPRDLYALKSLKKLAFRAQDVGVPAGIGALTQLEELDVSIQSVTEWPADFFTLSKLKVLDVSNTTLGGVPEAFGQLKQLTALRVSRSSWASGSALETLKRLLPATVIQV